MCESSGSNRIVFVAMIIPIKQNQYRICGNMIFILFEY
jgi:hypothetical protein